MIMIMIINNILTVKTAQQLNADLQLCPAANINTKIKLLKQLTTTYTETRNSMTQTNNKQRIQLQKIKVKSFKFSQILSSNHSRGQVVPYSSTMKPQRSPSIICSNTWNKQSYGISPSMARNCHVSKSS